MSIDSGRWLGKLLCQISLGEHEPGLMFRTTETSRSVTGTVRRNYGGLYLQVLIVERGRKRSYNSICFPAGESQKCWSLAGTTLRALVDLKVVTTAQPQRMEIQRTQDCWLPNNGFVSGSYAAACVNGTRNPTHRVQVNARGGLVNKSWWITAVICSTNCADPDWGWVEQRVKGVFNSANLQVQV
ncbi:hypothetical protein FRX31_011514 [Thalictrum thalictroides]|uniref:Uncharacterized protein n=1 Tax=Thalictrum thalictroides TaxID=46969 RepID=A0A7J6WNE4_THATH|nr:hypothetical protein FRX31_011514 [Thalictrum thalictroides]